MIGRIVEISNNNRYLSVYRGFLLVKSLGEEASELGRIPLDDILAVVTNAHGLSYSNNLLVSLLERDIPLVITSDKYVPMGILWPVESHHLQAKRMDAQIGASLPLKKSLWAQVVREKIRQQSLLLHHLGLPSSRLDKLAKEVKSGDPDNKEAMAARIYWTSIFGSNFLRNREAPGINALLNYGYTIIRSATARAVMAAGLHPSIGIHHKNASDAMRLVDDLMEPFRPLVDLMVFSLTKENPSAEWSISTEIKRKLVSILFWNVLFEEDQCPVMVAMQRLALSLSQVYLKERVRLAFPKSFEYRKDMAEDDFGI